MTGSQPFELCVIIDDDEDILLAARLLLRELFAEVLIASRPESAFERTSGRTPDVILLDGNFSRGATDGREGFAWLQKFLKRDPNAAIVMITAHGGVQIAVEAMKLGATDFVSKPWANDRLLATVRTAASLRQSRRDAQNRDHDQGVVPSNQPDLGQSQLLGRSPAMARVHSLIALCPGYVVTDALSEGQLVQLFAGQPAYDFGLYAAYLPSRHLAAKVRTFIDFLVQQYRHL